MTYEQFVTILGKIKYKEGWKIKPRDLGNGFFEFTWYWTAPNTKVNSESWRPTLNVMGVPRIIDPSYWSEDGLVKMAFEEVISCELHEVREFFRYEGVRIFNPHALVANHKQIAEYEEEVLQVTTAMDRAYGQQDLNVGAWIRWRNRSYSPEK